MKPKSIYSMLIKLSSQHTRLGPNKGYGDLLKFDLTNKKIWNGNTVIMDKGVIQVDALCGFTDLASTPFLTEQEASQDLEQLYNDYYVSVPNKHTSFSKSNFRAKTFDELTDNELAEGKPRQEAQYALEAFVMFSDLSHLFENSKHFFWQSKEYPGLIIRREWAT